MFVLRLSRCRCWYYLDPNSWQIEQYSLPYLHLIVPQTKLCCIAYGPGTPSSGKIKGKRVAEKELISEQIYVHINNYRI